MSQLKINLPEYFEVKMGNLSYEIDIETLVCSMAHQFISKTNNSNSLDNYDVVYAVTKSEIEDYLEQKNKNDDKFIDLFGNWIDDFKIYLLSSYTGTSYLFVAKILNILYDLIFKK